MGNEDNKPVSMDTENVEEQATEELVDGAVDTNNSTDEENTSSISKPESEKIYTEEDFNTKVNEQVDNIISKKIARNDAKVRREYENKYGDLVNVLKAGLNIGDNSEDVVGEATQKLTDFYTQRNVQIPKRSNYSKHDLEILGNQDAEEIISDGYDEIVRETDRLAKISNDKMSARERATFVKLAEARRLEEGKRELAEIGVDSDVLQDKAFKEYSEKLNPNLSLKEKYEMYSKTLPKKEVEQIGSMTGTITKDSGVKDYYSYEESKKFTKKDFDNNPELYNAVRKSMTKWGR